MKDSFKIFLIILMAAGAVIMVRSEAFSNNTTPLGDRISIRVRETGQVNGPRIRVKDVAHVEAPALVKEAIEKIEISSSPKPNNIDVLDLQKIEYQIRRQNYLPDNFSFECPPQVYVKRLSQSVSKDQVAAVVRQYLDRQFHGQTYQIVRLNIKGIEPYPQGEMKLLPDRENILGRNGKLYCHLDVIVEREKVDRLNISGEIAVFQRAFFASKALKKNTPVLLNDFYEKKVNIYNLSKDAVKDPQKISGKVLSADIRKGQCLTLADLAQPPLVKKGEIIQLTAKNKGLVITTSGISKEDGVENQLIRVENLYSGELVRAVVIQKSRVEVVY